MRRSRPPCQERSEPPGRVIHHTPPRPKETLQSVCGTFAVFCGRSAALCFAQGLSDIAMGRVVGISQRLSHAGDIAKLFAFYANIPTFWANRGADHLTSALGGGIGLRQFRGKMNFFFMGIPALRGPLGRPLGRWSRVRPREGPWSAPARSFAFRRPNRNPDPDRLASHGFRGSSAPCRRSCPNASRCATSRRSSEASPTGSPSRATRLAGRARLKTVGDI